MKSEKLFHIHLKVDRNLEGVVTSRYHIPGLECAVCGTYVQLRRIPESCPGEILKFLNDRKEGPMSIVEFERLNEVWARSRSAQSPKSLQPGDRFSPSQWRKPDNNREIYCPTFSNIVSSRKIFETVDKLAPDCIVPMEIENSDFLEWVFKWHSAVLSRSVDGNTVTTCNICGSSECNYSEVYRKSISDQEKGGWIKSNEILDKKVFSSHIFYPGFLATSDVATALKELSLKHVKFAPVAVRP